MSSLLEIDSVIKSFGGREILTDIYLRCETGDVIGILGRNGTGKSTLLKILFGTQSAERKFIRIDGQVLDKSYTSPDQICYLPQHNFLLHHLTVEKTIKTFLNKKNCDVFLDDSLLFPLRGHKVSQLSGGEMRYLEVKLLLHTENKFVLLDEPFNEISPVTIDLIKEMIRKASANKGIILTDHDYRNVLDVANKYLLLYDGGIKRISDKEELVRWNYISKHKAES